MKPDAVGSPSETRRRRGLRRRRLAQPEEPEEGGRVYQVAHSGGRELELRFANGAIRRAHPPRRSGVAHARSRRRQAARPYTSAATPVSKQPAVNVRVVAREGRTAGLDGRWLRSRKSVSASFPMRCLEAAQNRAHLRVPARTTGPPGQHAVRTRSPGVGFRGLAVCPQFATKSMRREAVENWPKSVAASSGWRFTIRGPPWRSCYRAQASGVTGTHNFHLLVRLAGTTWTPPLRSRPASITLDYLDLYGLRPRSIA